MNYSKCFYLAALICASVFSFSCMRPADAPINSMDKNFMVSATHANLSAIEVGNLALVQSTTDSVKMFATMLITDQTSNQKTINDTLASRFGFSSSLPTTPDSIHTDFRNSLSLRTGYDFDTAFINGQIIDHINAINLYKMEVAGAYNFELRDFAAAKIPVLEMHLEMAQSVAKSLHP